MTFKRVVAYIIDSLIIFALVTLFSTIEIINPSSKEFDKTVMEYSELYEDYVISLSNNASGLANLEKQINDLSYEVELYSLPVSIINLIIAILYFVVFGYFNNGQTVGKRFLGIKVVNKSNEKPSFVQIVVRSIIIYGLVTTTASLIILGCCTKEVYLNVFPYLTYVESILIFISFMFMLFREDKKGLHDLIAGTNVVETKTLLKEIKEK